MEGIERMDVSLLVNRILMKRALKLARLKKILDKSVKPCQEVQKEAEKD